MLLVCIVALIVNVMRVLLVILVQKVLVIVLLDIIVAMPVNVPLLDKLGIHVFPDQASVLRVYIVDQIVNVTPEHVGIAVGLEIIVKDHYIAREYHSNVALRGGNMNVDIEKYI